MAKVSRSVHEVSDHLFFTRKQIGLDLRSLPHVLKAERYDSWMTGAQWNGWVDDAGLEGRFDAEQIKNIKVPEDTPRTSRWSSRRAARPCRARWPTPSAWSSPSA
jgi:hypothetical protein